MWFSVVCALIDNDTRHYRGHNINLDRYLDRYVDTRQKLNCF